VLVAKDKLFSVRLDAETLEKLQKIAKRGDRSVNYIINEACKEYLKREK
jgi:predicted transcriptional regulator